MLMNGEFSYYYVLTRLMVIINAEAVCWFPELT